MPPPEIVSDRGVPLVRIAPAIAPVAVSMTSIAPGRAAYNRPPSGETASDVTRPPTTIGAAAARLARSTAMTRLPTPNHARDPSGETATVRAGPGSATCATALLDTSVKVAARSPPAIATTRAWAPGAQASKTSGRASGRQRIATL